AVFRGIIREFEEDYKERTAEELEIQLQFVSFGDMFTKLRTGALGGVTPDIAFVDSIKVIELAFGNALVRVDELEGFKLRYEDIDQAREQFIAASYDSAVVNRRGGDGLYGLPVQSTTV